MAISETMVSGKQATQKTFYAFAFVCGWLFSLKTGGYLHEEWTVQWTNHRKYPAFYIKWWTFPQLVLDTIEHTQNINFK